MGIGPLWRRKWGLSHKIHSLSLWYISLKNHKHKPKVETEDGKQKEIRVRYERKTKLYINHKSRPVLVESEYAINEKNHKLLSLQLTRKEDFILVSYQKCKR